MDKKAEKAKYMREYRAKNKDSIKRQINKKYEKLGYTKAFHDILVSYRLTKEQYDLMLLNQNNCCAICKSKTKLCIDHNHETNEVRALLCMSCNTAIGKFKENPSLIEKAIAYLAKHKEVA